MDDIQKDIHIFNAAVGTFGTNLSRYMNETNLKRKNEVEDIVHFISEVIHPCTQHRIPNFLVPHNEFKSAVMELEKKARSFNKKVAVPIENVSIAYEVFHTTCHYSEDAVTVIVNIPLADLYNKWVVYQVVPMKFAYDQYICSLVPAVRRYIAKQKNKIVEIDPTISRHCQVGNQTLCRIPRHEFDPSSPLQCVSDIIDGRPNAALAKSIFLPY